MAPAYCVGPVCSAVEKYPTVDELREAEVEAARLRATEATRLALTSVRATPGRAKLAALKPGQFPQP